MTEGQFMTIRLVPIDRSNWEKAVALEVKPHQLGNVGTNVLSLAEVSVRSEARARLILNDDEPVGMVVYLKNPEDDKFHVHRFMIDKNYQKQGFGEAALRLVVDEIRALEDFVSPIIIEFIDNNVDTQRVYERVGFKDTGRTVYNDEWGFTEKVFEI